MMGSTSSTPDPSASASDSALLAKIRRFADDVLFPQANAVDNDGELPSAALDAIVDEGFYGLVGPTELGGAGAVGAEQYAATEAMAGGCLTTCFVWMQHQGATAMTATATEAIRGRWAEALCRGELKAGIAFAHLLRPHVVISAEPAAGADAGGGDPGGWVLDGTAPWVTGWGYIDLILVAGRTTARGDDEVVWLLVDAQESATLSAHHLSLSAVDASATFAVRFDHHPVSAERVVKTQPYSEWRADYAKGLRLNASLALGIAERAARLLDEAGFGRPFEAELSEVRNRLDSAGPDEMAAARAAVSTLTVRMTAALVAGQGGRSILAEQHGQRLAREAMFLLIQGQTEDIKRAQIELLSTP